jgi:hypothetical protein
LGYIGAEDSALELLAPHGLPRSGTTLFASFSGKRRILLNQWEKDINQLDFIDYDFTVKWTKLSRGD